MTRINCVPVRELSGKHLVAEYRELPRVYALAQRAFNRGEEPVQHPKHYTLGTGHVRFFYSRVGYVINRHKQLITEMERRGYRPLFRIPVVPNLPAEWLRSWRPTPEALHINRIRIMERTK